MIDPNRTLQKHWTMEIVLKECGYEDPYARLFKVMGENLLNMTHDKYDPAVIEEERHRRTGRSTRAAAEALSRLLSNPYPTPVVVAVRGLHKATTAGGPVKDYMDDMMEKLDLPEAIQGEFRELLVVVDLSDVVEDLS